jgi:ribonuclease E
VPCKYCNGKGITPSTESLVLSFLRKLRLETLKSDISSVTGIVPVTVADYLVNKKRKELLDLEMRRNLKVRIEGKPDMTPGESQILFE